MIKAIKELYETFGLAWMIAVGVLSLVLGYFSGHILGEYLKEIILCL